MSEDLDDLRATQDDLIADAERLKEIELEKAQLPLDDPRVAALSEEAARISRRMALKSEAERDLLRNISEKPEGTGGQ